MKNKNNNGYHLNNYQIASIVMNGLLFIICMAMICSESVVDEIDYVFWICLALTSIILVCDTIRKNQKKKKEYLKTNPPLPKQKKIKSNNKKKRP